MSLPTERSRPGVGSNISNRSLPVAVFGISSLLRTPCLSRVLIGAIHPIDLVEGFLTSVILGARRLEHCGMLRTDQVLREIFGWQKGMASASTFQRFFHRFDAERTARLSAPTQKFIQAQVSIDYMTIDLDSSVLPRYGKQQKAEVGYNPSKKGRPSHHPLMAFCEETKMVVNGWMRGGKAQSSTQALEFLTGTLQIAGGEQKVGLLRADVGFYSHRIMSFLEQRSRPVPYLIKARMTTGVQKRILEQKRWHGCSDVAKGAIYAEISYQSSGWKEGRRMVLAGLPRKEKPGAEGWLFEEYQLLERYDFHAFVTNATYSMVEVHRRYNQRGDSENRIKELKYDYAIDAFAMHSFAATDAAFRFVLIAYNVMAIFKQAMLQPRVNHRLSTVKFQCIAIGSYLVQSGRKKILKLSAEGKRRHFLEHIFKKTAEKSPPYSFSIA
jgi:hypothetical protein